MAIFLRISHERSEGIEVRRRCPGAERARRVLVMAALMAASSLSVAQQTDEGDVVDLQQIIEMRQSNYKDIGGAFKGISDELRKGSPGMHMLTRYVKQLVTLAHMQSEQDWFPSGTGPEAGIKTAAKPEIWKNDAEFQKWRMALPVEADKLQKLVAGGGSIDAIKAQHKALGETCTGCHKPFRIKDD